jgi:ornithine carbamoyltransferase
MAVSLKGRHLLSIRDLAPEEFWQIVKYGEQLKLDYYAGNRPPLLAGKSLAMIFQKPSTRTRVSFEVAMTQLGGHALFLSSADIQLKRGETIADTAKVLSRMCDGIMARVFSHDDIEELARNSRVPVINGLSDLTHPVQILADYLTLYEKGVDISKMRLAYIGDGNNMTHSLLYAAARTGSTVAIATPKGYGPKKEVIEHAVEEGRKTGAKIEITNDPAKAAKGADVLYTDVWASMGQEAEHAARVKIFQGFQIDSALLKKAAPNAIVLHCLPAHRGEEIAADVIDGPQSVVFDEAENRLHAQKAVLAMLMGQ